MNIRVFNLGLPKTGTTTFARALSEAGLKIADFRVRKHQTKDPEIRGRFVAELLYEGYYNTGNPMAKLEEQFDGVSEMSALQKSLNLWPQMDFGIIMALRKNYPDAKFVATWRDSFLTSQSMLGWSDLGLERLPSANIIGLPPGFGETTKERETWIDTHYAHLDHIFDGDENYMKFDIAAPDAQDVLSNFLNIDLPWWGTDASTQSTVNE
jgi:hypothetical protein